VTAPAEPEPAAVLSVLHGCRSAQGFGHGGPGHYATLLAKVPI